MKWTENNIAAYIARSVLQRKCLVVVPNCSWPGSECDILGVTMNLRIIDVEVKISRADFRADASKDKWFHSWDWRNDGPYDETKRRRREWPRRVWKHYYCLPADIWTPTLLDAAPPASGILLIIEREHGDGGCYLGVERPAKPCRDAERVTPEDAIDIARLASLRMWDALEAAERSNEALRQRCGMTLHEESLVARE